MAKRPSPAEIAEIRRHFERHDEDNDGTIDSRGFTVMLKRMHVLLSPADEQKLFKAMDLDGSGKIEVGEFIDHYHTILALEKRAEEKQLENLKSKTTFSVDEIRAMYANFKRIACTDKDDGVIDKQEFRAMMLESQIDSQRNMVFYDGLFRMFDRDGSGAIDFQEFVTALAIYYGKAQSSQSAEERAKFFFSIYDVDGDGFISKEDLGKVLSDCLGANDIVCSAVEVDKLVTATFSKFPSAAASGKLDFATFREITNRM
eukprot:TRINITY_DN9291_c0_g1_i1.p1 TRINITY_DN9291_c0_g1~~TRINITY_DN9291_c0_g1_i1.p1  ORF type:complete len:259 (+),score=58.89 TRINITY_DN9291_c0_g1_i1:54-830(+)